MSYQRETYSSTDGSVQVNNVKYDSTKSGGEDKVQQVKGTRTDGSTKEYGHKTLHADSEDTNSSGGCFVTTAVLKSVKGSTDDCVELTAFRKFRDEYLLQNESDKKLVDVYYKTAPMLVAKIDSKENADAIYTDLWTNYIKSGFELIHNNKYDQAKDLYIAMLQDLNREFKVIDEIPVA